MSAFLVGVVTLVVGAGLAAATVVGVVQTASGSSTDPASSTSAVSYGTNN